MRAKRLGFAPPHLCLKGVTLKYWRGAGASLFLVRAFHRVLKMSRIESFAPFPPPTHTPLPAWDRYGDPPGYIPPTSP